MTPSGAFTRPGRNRCVPANAFVAAVLASLSIAVMSWAGMGMSIAEIHDGAWTGQLVGDILHGQAKADAVQALAQRNGFNLDQCAAYGDSINDFSLLELMLPASTQRNRGPRLLFARGRRVDARTVRSVVARSSDDGVCGGDCRVPTRSLRVDGDASAGYD